MWEYSLVQHRNLYHPKNITAPDNRMSFSPAPKCFGAGFQNRFARFGEVYEEQYAVEYGRYRMPVIQRAAEAFRLCGDWQEGIARIRCGDCGYDFFVPFSCKSFFLCPTILCCTQYRLQFSRFRIKLPNAARSVLYYSASI